MDLGDRSKNVLKPIPVGYFELALIMCFQCLLTNCSEIQASSTSRLILGASSRPT